MPAFIKLLLLFHEYGLELYYLSVCCILYYLFSFIHHIYGGLSISYFAVHILIYLYSFILLMYSYNCSLFYGCVS
jgi:hypothetical protein